MSHHGAAAPDRQVVPHAVHERLRVPLAVTVLRSYRRRRSQSGFSRHNHTAD